MARKDTPLRCRCDDLEARLERSKSWRDRIAGSWISSSSALPTCRRRSTAQWQMAGGVKAMAKQIVSGPTEAHFVEGEEVCGFVSVEDRLVVLMAHLSINSMKGRSTISRLRSRPT